MDGSPLSWEIAWNSPEVGLAMLVSTDRIVAEEGPFLGVIDSFASYPETCRNT